MLNQILSSQLEKTSGNKTNATRSVRLLAAQYRKFFAATILATLILQITIVTDTILVGQILGPVPMSGVRLASPVVNMLTVLGMLVGVGGATLVSIAMGKRRSQEANRFFSFSIILSLFFGAIFAIVVAPLAFEIASALSSEPSTVEYTATFLRIVAAASPVYILASVMAMLLRADACVKLSSIVLAAAGVANVAFDLLFMGVMGMGIEGSALATDSGMAVAVLLSLIYFRWPRRSLKLINPLSSGADNASEGVLKTCTTICKAGMSGALKMFLACLALLFLNLVVSRTAGVMGIAFMTICGNLQLVAVAVFSAAGQAATPMEGILYGEGDYNGIKLLFEYVLKLTCVTVIAIIVVIWLVPDLLISMFCPDKPPIDGADWLLRVYTLGFLPLALNYILTYYYNTVQQRGISTAITLCENLVLYLPLIWILSTTFGLIGTVTAFLTAELLTLAAAMLFAKWQSRKQDFAGILLLPENPPSVVYEASSEASSADAVSLAHSVKEVLDEYSAKPSTALRAAMSVEELVENCSARAKDSGAFLDIRVLNASSEVVLSVRDNAIPLDPISAAEQAASNKEFDNMAVLLAIAESVDYSCIMGLNQVVVKIGKTADCESRDGE